MNASFDARAWINRAAPFALTAAVIVTALVFAFA